MTVSYRPTGPKRLARVALCNRAEAEEHVLDTYHYHSGCLELRWGDTVTLIPWERITSVAIVPYDKEPDPEERFQDPSTQELWSNTPTAELLRLILYYSRRPTERTTLHLRDGERVIELEKQLSEWRDWATPIIKLAGVIRSHGPAWRA